jgi:molybdate transport system substrate-binding protein
MSEKAPFEGGYRGDAQTSGAVYSPTMLRLIFAIFCLFTMLPDRALHAAEPVTIFAAASTQQAVDAVIGACPEKAGVTCRGVYAASSTLARQIKNGAPADIFISANLIWMDYLTESGAIVPNSRQVIAHNQLVAIAPRARAPKIDSVATLLDWLAADRVALGDPAHVPAGIYAAEALTSMQAWDRLQGRVLALPNVRAALAVVARGEAFAGIVYATDAQVSDDVIVVYKILDSYHAPIVYPMGQVAGPHTPGTEDVVALFKGLVGQHAFRDAGFQVSK